MGEIADMMLGGELCECCGVFLEGEAEGIPRYCSKKCRRDRTPVYVPPAKKVKCSCGRKVSAAGLADHKRDKGCK